MKSSKFWGSILITVILIVACSLALRQYFSRSEKSLSRPPTGPAAEHVQPKDFSKQGSTTNSGPRPNDEDFSNKENGVAVLVPGNPLRVKLLFLEEMGEISIERYEDGKPTGKPMKSGTPMKLPDPNNPGEYFHFQVP